MSITNSQLQTAYEGLLRAAAQDLAPVWEAHEKHAGIADNARNAWRALRGKGLEIGGENIDDVIRADVGKLRNEMSWADAEKAYLAEEAKRNAAGTGFGGELAANQAAGNFGPRGQQAVAGQQASQAANVNNAAHANQQVAAPSTGLNWKHYAGLGGAALATGGGAFALGRHQANAESDRKRNLAFGAGLATGVAAPSLVRGASTMLNQSGYGRPVAGPPPSLPYYPVR